MASMRSNYSSKGPESPYGSMQRQAPQSGYNTYDGRGSYPSENSNAGRYQDSNTGYYSAGTTRKNPYPEKRAHDPEPVKHTGTDYGVPEYATVRRVRQDRDQASKGQVEYSSETEKKARYSIESNPYATVQKVNQDRRDHSTKQPYYSDNRDTSGNYQDRGDTRQQRQPAAGGTLSSHFSGGDTWKQFPDNNKSGGQYSAESLDRSYADGQHGYQRKPETSAHPSRNSARYSDDRSSSHSSSQRGTSAEMRPVEGKAPNRESSSFLAPRTPGPQPSPLRPPQVQGGWGWNDQRPASPLPDRHTGKQSSNGYLQPAKKDGAKEAIQVLNILRKRIVLLTGGRDRRKGPVLTFPDQPNFDDFPAEDVLKCLAYLAIIPSDESMRNGFTILIDNRHNAYKNSKALFKLLQHALEGSIHAVYVIQGDKQKFNLSSFRREKHAYGFEPQFVALSKLDSVVSQNQLTADFGGTLPYNHEIWLENRVIFEKYEKEARLVGSDLDQTYEQIVERLRQDDKVTPQELLRRHRELQETVIHVPERVVMQGRQFYNQMQVDVESAFQGQDEVNYSLDQVVMMNSVKQNVERLEAKLEKIRHLWRERQIDLGRKMQLSELETAMKTVVDWILGPAERLLASQTDIGESYKVADELRKQHEQLELKCTDTYGTYAELRHKAELVMQEGGENAPDIEAQRDFMDMVCRSYAARLERRRNLVITSVRFHRLAEELHAMLEDLYDSLATDIEVADAETAKELIKELEEKCENINYKTDQTLNEGQNLLDQLALLIKNAFGQDVSPDNRRHVNHVQRMMESLQDRKVKCDDLAEVRKLKLTQIMQLRKCEGEADQAIRWILELCEVTVETQLEGIHSPVEAEHQRAEQQKVEETAKKSYDYGKQLIQTGLMLRRSLYYDLDPNHQLSRDLNEAWRKFSMGINEKARRLNMAAMFNSNADQLLDRMEEMMVVISQTINMEITVEDLVIHFSQKKMRLNSDHVETNEMGRDLVARLLTPFVTHDGGEKRLEREDHGAVELIRAKLDTLVAKMKQVNTHWDEQTKGIYLGPNGQLLGPDGRPYRPPAKRSNSLREISQTSVTTVTKSQSNLLGAAPPGDYSGSDPQWRRMVQQLKESHDWIRVRIQQMEPDLMEVGSTLEEARALRKEHDDLLMKLNAKQKDVTELLARADDLAAQNRTYQEVYAAMAESLGEAWKDLNTQLDYRKMLLDQSIAFHERAQQFSHRMEQAQDKFNNTGLATDVETARRLLQQHQDMKKTILEASMMTLQEGQSLLEKIREMGLHADVQNRHATTSACYGIEHLLELLQDRRRRLEELWLQRKIRLEQALQLLLLDQEVQKVSAWFEKVGDAYLNKKDLGDSLASAKALQEEHLRFEIQAREIQETVLRLLRTADQLVHSAHYDAEGVKKRLQLVDKKCEDFMLRLDNRRKNLALAINFFSLAQTATSKLNEIEVQLTKTDLPRNSAALAEQHAFLSNAITEVSTSALREGRILLERVGRSDSAVHGVSQTVEQLQERCKKLEEMCKARYEAGEKSQAFNQFQDKFNNIATWLAQIGHASLSTYRDMGTNLSSARDFLELHERLEEDLRDKMSEMKDLSRQADSLAESGGQEGQLARDKVGELTRQYDLTVAMVERRIKLALSYVTFHKKAQQLAIQMDALEQYLKIEKLDATQIPDSAIKHKETKYDEMSVTYSDVESKGKTFVKEAEGVKDDSQLDTRRAITVVETVLLNLSERKFVITEYYEHWKVHVTTGKEFKSQWHQFIQDARKTIDWIMRIEDDFFPVIAGELGSSMDSVLHYQKKLDEFLPMAKKAQEDVEKHLKTAELLSLKGDTKGQKDQIINELLRVHTRFQARITEYQVLINMTINFFKNLSQLDKLIEDTETDFNKTEMPKEVTRATLMLKEHESNRNKMEKLIDFSHEEGEAIVVRVRQQDSEAVAKDEVQNVLQLTEARRHGWERAWDDHKAKLEQNLQICQFYFDLKQIHNELDELHRQLRARHGNYGSSLSSVKMTSEAFRQFEKSVELIEGKVQQFNTTAEVMIRDQHYDSRRIRREVDDVHQKWTDFHSSISEYRNALDDSAKFYEVWDDCEGWVNEASQFLVQVGRKATECKSSQDANELITGLDNFKNQGGALQNERLRDMEKIAVGLYGPVQGPNKMQYLVDRNQETFGSFSKAINELGVLRDNLLKKEQILAEMNQVVETKAPRQPRFIVPLQNVEIREGQRFTFECRLECDSSAPRIEWFKDTLPIQTPDYETTYKDGLCRLTIEETFSEDSAKWTCKATTDNGVAETSATLKVKETHKKIVPPDFSKHLKSMDFPEGTSFVFECHVTGIPSPSISWYKDEDSIDNSPDYVITQINGTCCLKIRKLTKDHSARYTCKATNPGGEASSSARLNVITVQKPAVTKPLTNMAVAEGTKNVNLTCQFSGEPAPQVQWLRNDQPVMPSTVFRIIVETTTTTLEIREVFPEDTGTYTVIIKNIGGETRTSCLLTIEGAYSTGGEELHEPMAPKFVQQLQNKEVSEGSRARLDCVIVGYPEPEVIWYHNDRPVKESKDFQLLFEGDRCSIIIREVYLEDSGEYRCMARNPRGQVESKARLMVEPLSELSDVSVGTAADVVPPKFTQLLKDIESPEGQMVVFECRVIGHPAPVVKWYRGRQKIENSADFRITYSRELHTLTIPEVFKEDEGNFMCKATNNAGEAKCYASLSVKQTSEKHVMKTRLVETSHSTTTTTTISGHSPPEFKTFFKDMRAKPGSPCKFEVIIVGVPKPRVRWLFNNEPVVSPDYQISTHGDTHVLYIPEVFDEDAGRFSIMAENDAGKATCSALLVVVDEAQGLPGDGSPPETPRITTGSPFKAFAPVAAPMPRAAPPPPQAYKPEMTKPVQRAPAVYAPQPPAAKPIPPAPSPTFQEQIRKPAQAPPPPPKAFTPPREQSPVVQAPRPSDILKQQKPAQMFQPPKPTPTPPAPAPPSQFQRMDVKMELPVPPEFIQPLKNLAAQQGTRVTFEGIIKGKPEPTIKWYKSGKELSSGADFQISYRNGRVELTIPEVFEEDAGRYVCAAENPGGRKESAAELIVKASMIPPEFPERLHNKAVKEGDSVRFTVRVQGQPAPDVTWYREGSQIVSSPDFEILQDGNLHSLYIPEVFCEDSGTFSVKAENQAGLQSCTAELKVQGPAPKPMAPVTRSPVTAVMDKPKPALYTPPKPSPAPPAPREPTPTWKPQVEPTPTWKPQAAPQTVEPAPMWKPQPIPQARPTPQFTRPLMDKTVKEGERATLECATIAFPEPERVQWFRDSVEIHSSADYQLTYGSGVCTLTIAEVFPEDSGNFSCTITVNGVNNSTTMYLKVTAAPPAAPRKPDSPPMFGMGLTNQPLHPHQTAHFECKVDGHPPPEILWTRRGHPLVDKTRYKSTYDQYTGTTTLTILDLREEDEGEYTCTAINSRGEASTSALLLGHERYQDWLRQQPGYVPEKAPPVAAPVAPPMPPPKAPPVAPPPEPIKRTPTPTRTSPFYRPMSERVLDKPAETKLSDYESDGTDGSFKVSSFEKRLMKEVDFREGRVDPKHHVPEAREAFDVNLPLDQAYAPRFEQKPNNFKLIEGSDATFVCKVTGRPSPHITWYHNGRLIRPSNRYEIKLTKDGYVSLRIRIAFPEDGGHYTCCATNVVGRDTCSSELYVEGGQIDQTSYVEPGTLMRMLQSPDDVRGDGEPGGVSEKHFRPVFRKVPEDKDVQEGLMVRFDCIVTGRPAPELFWYRDGTRVYDDSLHKIVINESGINSLIIHAVARGDAGQYVCVAKNRAGEDSFKVHLNVTPRQTTQAPRFTERMMNQTVPEGQAVAFHAHATGVPVPMMSWQKDGKMIDHDDHYKVETEGGRCSLYIAQTRPDDNAWFQCTAANVGGTASNRARLIVQVEARKPSPERRLSIPKRTITTPTSDMTAPVAARPTSEPVKAPPTPDYKSRADIMLSPTPPPIRAPTPTQVWKHVDLPKSPVAPVVAAAPTQAAAPWQPAPTTPIEIKSIATAPSPVVTRPEPVRPTQANIQLSRPVQAPHAPPKESALAKYIQDEDSAKPKDEVDDSVKPEDREPAYRPTAQEMVQRGPETEPDAADMFNRDNPRPPKFKTQIKPQLDVQEAEPAHFECRLVPINDPDMVVEWYKDGKLLKSGHRFKPMHDFGFCALDILYTYPEDNGVYMCHASNKYGTDSTEAVVRCAGKISVIYASQLPEGDKSMRVINAMEEGIRRDQLKHEEPETGPEPGAPLFDLMPEAVQVEEGDTAKFMVKIGGHPRPRLTWWINGAIVVNSQRFQLHYDGMIHVLDIPKVRDYDQGTIRVVAKNPLGEAECSTTLTVLPREDWRSRLKQAPRSTVEVELEKKKKVELRTIELDVALRKPKTTVMELRALERSNQERALNYKDEEVQRATMEMNLQHTQFKRVQPGRVLNVWEPTAHVDSAVHIARARAMLQMPDDYQRTEHKYVVEKTLPGKREPPTFTKPLANIPAKEGQVVRMEVLYTGFPTPDIQWFREGVEIQPSRDFQISTANQKSFLVIPEVFMEDAGTYTVRAYNQFGMAECRAVLTVQEDTNRVKDAPPEFRVQMHDISIRIREPATFDCQITGHPRPEVYWVKDGQRMTDSTRWKFIVEEEHVTLLIYEVRPADQGVYECNVFNKLGKATCTARLNVEGQVEPTKQQPVATQPISHKAPQLIEPLRDQHINEGESLTFSCKVVAQPEPIIQWYYNNQVIKPSKYFQMQSGNGVHSLSIAGAFPEDEGVYKCTARNQAGEVTCIAHLRVTPTMASEPELDLHKNVVPPKFVKPINGLDVVEGNQAVFEAVVAGQPPPEVTWFREGHQIQHSEEFQIVRDGDKCLLVIKEVFPEDSGIFTCRISNPAGVAESSAELYVEDPTKVSAAQVQLAQPTKAAPPASAELRVKQPERKAPTIIKAPSPIRDVAPGSATKLTVEIQANPPPKFAWFTNGQQIRSSQRHKISFEQNVVTLLIFNVQPQDSGEYLLKAKNELGEVTCKTVLNIKPTEKVVPLPMDTQDFTVTATRTETVTSQTTETTRTSSTKDMVPTFTQPLLQEVRVKENSVAKLMCQVEAYPDPDITWHVNGVQIEAGPRYMMGLEGQKSFLEIQNVKREDTGVYTCRAVSELGEAVTSTTLYVIVPEPVPQPPRFTEPLANVTGSDGTEVTLTCVVQGSPPPEISWFHNHKCIDRSEDFVINYNRETGRIDLVIVDCLPDDQGLFKCIARNPAGQAITECSLTVTVAPPPPTAEPPPQPTLEPQVKTETVITVKEEPVVERKASVEVVERRFSKDDEVKVTKKVVKRVSGQPPRFTKPIQPCVVKEGESCTFSAVVTGAPEPEIVWLKDKQDMKLTERHVPTFDPATGTCTLTITNANPHDVGVYSCRAQNPAGRATCTANVVVVPPDAEVTITEKTVSVKKEKVTIIGEHETRSVESSPTFSQNLMPITEVNEGDNVKFQCKVSGEPVPEVTWYFNGKEVTSTNHITVTFDKTVTTLIITNVVIEDTGEYICKAKNNLGEGITKTFLRVKRPEPQPTQPIPQPTSGQPVQEGQVPMGQQPGVARPPTEGPADLPPAPLSEPCAVIPLFPPQEEPPRFTMPLRNLSVMDGDQAVFRVFYSGAPQPRITWYFNSQPIKPSQDFQIHVDIHRQESTLVVVEVFPEDEGEYMVKAENPLGTAVTHCHLFVKIPSSSEDEGEKIVSKTVEVVKTQIPVNVRETRRFSETIAIDHKEKLKEMAVQFALPQPRHERSELHVRQSSVPRGIKMNVEVQAPIPAPQYTQEKHLTMTQRAQAVSTQRQEMMVPITQQRRFSETIAIDHSKKHQPVSVPFQLPTTEKVTKTQVTVQQKPALKGVKMEVELPEVRERTQMTITQRKRVETVETQREELRMQLEGGPPRFVWDLQSLKVMDGEEAKLLCKVIGNPMPEITWYHNSKLVVENPDFRTYYNKDTGECVLHILEVFPQDTGAYECVAINQYGKAVTKSAVLVEVYEYVPDSEEATASQTESIVSTSSIDEVEFQAKTQRFLENMEKLRKEISEDTFTETFKEEVVEVEEMDVEEHGYEETVSMADVKWQKPKHAVTKDLRISPEKMDVDITSIPTAQTKEDEVLSEVSTVEVEGAKPSHVRPQEAKMPEEAADDIVAEGADMSQQQEIQVELSLPSVEGKKETRAAPVTEERTPEEAEQLIAEAGESMQHEEYSVELAAPEVKDKEVTRVEPVDEKQSLENIQAFTGATMDTTHEEQIVVEFSQPEVEGKKETRVEPIAQKPAEEMAQDLIGEASQGTQEEEYHVELAQPEVGQKQETRVIVTHEEHAPMEAGELAPETSETTHEEEITIQLSQPEVERRESRVDVVVGKGAEEIAQDLIGEASEGTQQDEYTVELAKPDVGPKQETHVEVVLEEHVPMEAGELAPETSETTQEEEITIQLAQPEVEPKKETRVEVVVGKAAEEVADDLIGEASEGTQHEEYTVELAKPDVEQQQETRVEIVLEEHVPMEAGDLAPEASETTHEEEIIIQLSQPEVEEKRETRVEVVLEKHTEEVAMELVGEASEGTQQDEYTVELAQPDVGPKQETRVEVVLEEHAPMETGDLAPELSETTHEEEITIQLSQPEVEKPKETRVEAVMEEEIPHEAGEFAPETTETTQEQEILVELAKPDVEEKTQTRVEVVLEVAEEEVAPDLIGEASEDTQHEEYTVELAQPEVESMKETRVEPVEEKTAEELTTEFVSETTDTTQEEEITVELAQPEVEKKEETRVEAVEEKTAEELTTEFVSETTDTTQEEEITVELAQPEVEKKEETRVEAVEEKTAEELTTEFVPETTDTTQEEEITVELAQPEVEKKRETRVEVVLEKHESEEIQMDIPEETTETSQEEQIIIDLDQHAMEPKKETRVEVVLEKHESEEIQMDIPEETTETTQEEQIIIDLDKHAMEPKKVSRVQAVEEQNPEELTDSITLTTEETTQEEEIVVEMAQPGVEDKTVSLVQTVEEAHPEEVASDFTMAPEESTQGEEITMELAQPDVEAKRETRVETQLEEVTEETSVDVIQVPTEVTQEEEIAQPEMAQPIKEKPAETLVQPLEEKLAEENVDEVQELPSETTQQEDVLVEMSQSAVGPSKLSHVQAQLEKMPEEITEGIVGEVAQEQPESQEIPVELVQTTVEGAKESLTITQEAKMTEEGIQDLTDQLPSPEVREGMEVVFELAQPSVRDVLESRAEAIEDRLSEGSLEENVEEFVPHAMAGEEIISELAEPTKESKAQTQVDIVQETLEEGKEEEIYYEIPEPGIAGEEITVDMGAVETTVKAQTLVTTQEAKADVEVTEEGATEFTEETTHEEQVIVTLGQAEAEQPKPALVAPQEAVMEPQKTEELTTEEITQDIPQESVIEITLEAADSEAPKPSLVSTQEEQLELQATNEDIIEFTEDVTRPEEIQVDMDAADKQDKPVTHVKQVQEGAYPENTAMEYIGSIKEVYMIPQEVRPEYGPSVVEKYRLETRVHPQAASKREEEESMEMKIVTDEETAEETRVRLQRSAQGIIDIRAIQEITEEREQVTETETMEEEVTTTEKRTTETTRTKTLTREGHEISIVSLMAPVFEIPLSDVTIADGEKAVLECVVNGVPEPTVTWYVEGVEIRQSVDFQITYEEGVSRLTILDALPEDEGEYTVKAVNEAGSCVTTAYLTVLPLSASESETSTTEETTVTSRRSSVRSERRERVSEEFHKMEVDVSLKVKKEVSIREFQMPSGPQGPRFIVQLEPKEIFESMPVKLECEVTGNPEPEITWYKDDVKLTSTEHTEIVYHRGLCQLFINKVTIEDEAEYKCEARNTHGVAYTLAELLVEKLISEVEQIILEEFYEIEVEMLFKWKAPVLAALPISQALSYDSDVEEEDMFYDALEA